MAVEISWLGHSCFRLASKEVVVITDPFSPSLGYPWPSPSARIVTVSHDHPGHNYREGVAGDPRVIAGPGEYEISRVFITGFPSYHDSQKGAKLGKNTIYLIELEGIAVCHLGDLGYLLSAEEVARLGKVDVLLIPVGGGNALGAAQAAEVVRSIEAKVFIPMHYRLEGMSLPLEPLDGFLREVGAKAAAPQPRLSLTSAQLPQTPQLVLLSLSGKGKA